MDNAERLILYLVNRLDGLDDAELQKLDFDSAIAASDLSANEKEKVMKFFRAVKENLFHHGIKGQKWGVRRFQNADGSLTSAGKKRIEKRKNNLTEAKPFTIKTRSGATLTAEPVKPWSLGKKILHALVDDYEHNKMGRRGDANYTLKDASGKKIGELSLMEKHQEGYIDWITIDKKQRGQGYASDIVKNVLNQARDAGYNKVYLNALKKPRPLYERLGFEYDKNENLSTLQRIAEFEVGCKHMSYDLRKTAHSFYHHGIKGQKWGVRRFQNADGSLTSAGKRRVDDGSSKPRINKKTVAKVAGFIAGATTVAAAAAYVHKNPAAIGQCIAKVANSRVGQISKQTVAKGKDAVKAATKEAAKQVKEGIKEGAKDAPKKLAKTIVYGSIMKAGKEMSDRAFGRDNSDTIFKANDNKMIGKFWKSGSS